MATTFLEPGGDSTFNVASTTAGGFWGSAVSNNVATDFIHGNHIKSISYGIGTNNSLTTIASVVSDAGARISFYFYMNALPTGTAVIFNPLNTTPIANFFIKITSGGILQITNSGGTQLGSNGFTLFTGTWYRISLAYVIASSSVNEIRLFVNGILSISLTNVTVNANSTKVVFGSSGGDATFDFRTSDHYIDNQSSLDDTGNIWVIAKRPNANGTTNGFTGSGAGSGYGTGNSVYVNERPLSTSSKVAVVGAGSAVTEEYNIESNTTGDFNLLAQTTTIKILDYVGWVYTSSLVGETINIILNGVSSSQAITSTNTMYTKVAGSTTYPAGTGTDIGIQTDTSLTTVSLFECGVIVAFLVPLGVVGNYPPYIHSGTMSRNERAT